MTRAKYSLTSSSVIGCLVSLFKISARVHPVNAFAPKDGQQKIAFAHLIMFEISAVLRNRYFPISIFKQPPSRRKRIFFNEILRGAIKAERAYSAVGIFAHKFIRVRLEVGYRCFNLYEHGQIGRASCRERV